MITSSIKISKNFLPIKAQNYLRKLVWKSFGLSWQLESGLDVKIESRAEWSIYNEIFVNKEYDLPIKRAMESTTHVRTLNFLDLGANVGFFALRVADLIQRAEIPFQIISVEGSPSVYEELKSRLGAESALADNIRIIHGLVGKRQGSEKIFVSDFHVSNSLYAVHPSGPSRSVEVPYIDLNSLYNEDFEIDLLKCDIEGAELSFIENYEELLSRVKSAVFEFHHDMCDINRCFNILRDRGFVNHENLCEESTGLTSLELFWK